MHIKKSVIENLKKVYNLPLNSPLTEQSSTSSCKPAPGCGGGRTDCKPKPKPGCGGGGCGGRTYAATATDASLP